MFGKKIELASGWRQHVCGLHYMNSSSGQPEMLYLPQVELQAHATILATTSKTTLTQTFINPSSTKGIREVKYTFPLYDGVSVVGFTCHVGERTIVGEVKEKEKARTDFKAAVTRGETAGLFEQLDSADVFLTTVGNVPPDAKVIIKITYLGELKHDMEVDGIRFMIPNIIAPRYGRYPPAFYDNKAHNAVGSGISITVDAEMSEGSFIQKILSPSHPISISMGTTSISPEAEPTMTRASATLSLGSTQLDKDFILQLVAKDTGVPKALLESHPTIPNQRALMATLVPKFALPQERPEIVFICDRSGSMSGSSINLVRQALQVFLKSLPVGIMFNICSFGSSYSFLWPRSVAYSQATLDEAVRHVGTFDANYGGTEMLTPVKCTIEQRYKDIPLEVMLLTDGAIWNQQALFTYLNDQVSETKSPIRIFSLGVGAGVSHSLIEGLARAGNGFSQTVGEGKKMDAKVVRMLKGALSPHIHDYTLEVKYAADTTNAGEDDFEIIEKVIDSLTVKLDLNDAEKPKAVVPKKPISLFDASVQPDKEEPPPYDETGESRYSHLPKVAAPHIIQAPQNIPTLFAFNRTTVYLLLGPDALSHTPTSVILRGTSVHGPLELEIPIQVLDTPSETIHQLAAKKAMSELEEGRGWLAEAKDSTGELIKNLYESRFSSMMEREAVRLGIHFQVNGKWCSFVAIEKKQESTDRQSKHQEKEDWDFLEDEEASTPTVSNNSLAGQTGGFFGHNPSANTRMQAQYTPSLVRSSLPVQPQPTSYSSVYSSSDMTERSYRAPQQTRNDSPSTNIPKRGKLVSFFGEVPQVVVPPPPPPPHGSSTAGLFGNTQSKGPSPQQATQVQASPLAQALSSRKAVATDDAWSPPSSPKAASSASSFPAANLNTAPVTSSNNTSPTTQQTQTPSLFGNFGSVAASRASNTSGSALFSSAETGSATASTFGSAAPTITPPSISALFGSAGTGSAAASSFGSAAPTASTTSGSSLFGGQGSGSTAPSAFGSAAQTSPFSTASSSLFGAAPHPTSSTSIETDDDILALLIKLQTFEGYWEWNADTFRVLKISESVARDNMVRAGYEELDWVTALVIAFFEKKMEKMRGSWELVVEKARSWLAGRVAGENKVEEMVSSGKTMF